MSKRDKIHALQHQIEGLQQQIRETRNEMRLRITFEVVVKGMKECPQYEAAENLGNAFKAFAKAKFGKGTKADSFFIRDVSR